MLYKETSTGFSFFIDITTARTPIDGPAIANRWWTYHIGRGVLFYAPKRAARLSDLEGQQEDPSPQCNTDEYISRTLTAKLYPDLEVKHIEVVFAEHARREMNKIRAQLRDRDLAVKERK